MQVGKPGAEQTESPSPGPVLGLAVGVTWVSAAVGSPSALLIPWGHVPGPSKGDWDQGLLNSGHPGGGGPDHPHPLACLPSTRDKASWALSTQAHVHLWTRTLRVGRCDTV